jgi:hypothetical protein
LECEVFNALRGLFDGFVCNLSTDHEPGWAGVWIDFQVDQLVLLEQRQARLALCNLFVELLKGFRVDPDFVGFQQALDLFQVA